MDVQQLIAAIQQPAGYWLWLLVLVGMLAGGIGYRFLFTVYRNWRMNRRFKRGEVAEKSGKVFTPAGLPDFSRSVGGDHHGLCGWCAAEK